MLKLSAFILSTTIVICTTAPNVYCQQVKSTMTSFKAKDVQKLMEKVADWQLNQWDSKGSKWPMWDWTNAAGYTGILALADISKNKRYIKTLVKISDTLNWETGPRRFYADDYCIGQTYSILYKKYRDEKMISNFRRLADSIVNMPHNESLEWKNSIRLREWAWCDALFMGPTALSYLSTATGDRKYLDIANKLWWKTTDYLYDSTEHLYWRDGSYIGRKERNGQKMFWSRGNGWVMGGLVRVLENMPNHYPDRARFVRLYKDMAAKIASIQQADGSWHASLLDPASHPAKETSGTGFYTYALLWGMNHGLLNKQEYWPVIRKAWTALSSSVHENGMLGNVQPVGAAPDKVDDSSTEIYGVGAFLLAGSELHEFIKGNKKMVRL